MNNINKYKKIYDNVLFLYKTGDKYIIVKDLHIYTTKNFEKASKWKNEKDFNSWNYAMSRKFINITKHKAIYHLDKIEQIKEKIY